MVKRERREGEELDLELGGLDGGGLRLENFRRVQLHCIETLERFYSRPRSRIMSVTNW